VNAPDQGLQKRNVFFFQKSLSVEDIREKHEVVRPNIGTVTVSKNIFIFYFLEQQTKLENVLTQITRMRRKGTVTFQASNIW
jgi:hypothetical protein